MLDRLLRIFNDLAHNGKLSNMGSALAVNTCANITRIRCCARASAPRLAVQANIRADRGYGASTAWIECNKLSKVTYILQCERKYWYRHYRSSHTCL